MRPELYIETEEIEASPFHELMRNQVQEILLVSSLYDSFLLSQDGQLRERLISEFMELNLKHTPGITHKFDAEAALKLAHDDPRYNLIITTMRVGDIHVLEFAGRVSDEGLNVPIILLTFDEREITELHKHNDANLISRSYIWQGDFRILLAIVKNIEDQWNVKGDTRAMGVPVILLIEDNIRFYSSCLPMIYAELMKHTHHLLSDSVNLYLKLLRMRARPKIIHCENFEEAWEYYGTYEDYI
ncbi:MAG TPA: histidine kinase, partial [Bacteroidetes bacterium]|nr:histidine kinase [Bacteroidota bacterium]